MLASETSANERSLKMEKIRAAVLDEPGLYLLGMLVSATLLAFGFPTERATTVLFWWFVVCAVPIGLYMTFCSVMAFFLEKEIADETYPGWNLEHRPSLQDLKKTDPEQARWMGEMYDMLDQTSWHSGVIHLVLTISIFVSLVVGAFFLQSFVINAGWWRLILAIVLIGYGLIIHSNKAKEGWFEKMFCSLIPTQL